MSYVLWQDICSSYTRAGRIEVKGFSLMLGRTSFAVIVLAASLAAQSAGQETRSGQFTFEGQTLGSVNSFGAVTRLDGAAGYMFNRYWSADLGLPFYFVNPSQSGQGTISSGNFNGIGNVYGRIRFTMANSILNYVSTVTGTAPTGDREKGLSTGRGTVDWSNYFDHGFGRLTPFGEVGIANAVSDTQFFIRPYTTAGMVTHAQGGARYRLARWMTTGVSGYLIEPHGQQTVVSRVVSVRSTAPPAAAKGVGAVNGLRTKRVFETQNVTTGESAIAHDRGFSAWLLFNLTPVANFYGGYTHSTQFNLDTVFFGIGIHLRQARGLGGL